jgi:hypothetical protein
MYLTDVEVISDTDPECVVTKIGNGTRGWHTTEFKVHFSTAIQLDGSVLYSALIEYYSV